MKKIFYIFLFLLSLQNISAQHLFQKTYGNLLDDWFEGIEVVDDTTIFAVGYTRENNPMNSTVFLVCLNDSGNIKWSKSINIGEDDIGFQISKLTNNTLLITGETHDYISPSDYDIMLICLDLSGNILWKKNWGTINSELYGNSLESSGNIYSTGLAFLSSSMDTSGLKLTKTDMNGNILWDNRYLSGYSLVGYNMQEIDANRLLISGAINLASTSYDDVLLMEIDSSGNIIWAKSYGGTNGESYGYITKTNDNSIIIAVTTLSFDTSSANGDILLIKTDSLGNEVWSKKYGDSGYEQVKGIARDTSGNYIIWGSSTSYYPSFQGTGLVFKIDDNGDLLWSRLYGGTNLEILFDLKQLHEQLLICGQIRSPLPPSNRDGYLIKTDWFGESGCNDTVVSISYSDVVINTYNVLMTDTMVSFIENLSYSTPSLTIQSNVSCDSVVYISENGSQQLLSIYPNPNNGRFFIETNSHERIKAIEIYNMLGQKVFFNATYLSNVIEVNLKDKVTGLYLIKIINKNKNYFLKTIIL